MHKLFSFILLFLAFAVTASDTTPSHPLLRTIKWEKIAKLRNSDIVAYIDTSTLSQTDTDGSIISFGLILYRRDLSFDINIAGSDIKTNSLARYYAIDCNDGLAASLTDFYFNLPRLPAITDVPDMVLDHAGQDSLDVFEVPKDHALYTTLCPKFI